VPRIEGGHVYPMDGPGLGVELRPSVFERSDLIVRRSSL
jgi:galactonate dehydratase